MQHNTPTTTSHHIEATNLAPLRSQYQYHLQNQLPANMRCIQQLSIIIEERKKEAQEKKTSTTEDVLKATATTIEEIRFVFRLFTNETANSSTTVQIVTH